MTVKTLKVNLPRNGVKIIKAYNPNTKDTMTFTFLVRNGSTTASFDGMEQPLHFIECLLYELRHLRGYGVSAF